MDFFLLLQCSSSGYLKKLTEQELNNTVYVKSLEIGGSLIRDYESSYFIHPNAQVRELQTRSLLNLQQWDYDKRHTKKIISI